MGCDIHSFAERRNSVGEWEIIEGVYPFEKRIYGVFAFLADVRNDTEVEPISPPRGIPEDSPTYGKLSKWLDHDSDTWHSGSWLSIRELLDFDYDREFVNEDYDVPEDYNRETTYREFLGSDFFANLERLKEIGADRVVFCFDN
jgi:hypothetical protein